MSRFKAVSDLAADAEDLLDKLGKVDLPDVQALKERVRSSVSDLRNMTRQGVSSGADTIDDAASALTAAMRREPWVAAAVGAAVAVAAVYAVFSWSRRD